MNLTPEQLAYLKSLESPKKRRKFMLDCLVKNALGESEFLKQVEDTINSPFNIAMQQTSTAPETLKATKDIFLNYERYLLDQENHLCWIYNRLMVIHGESPLFDYMHKLREIAVNYKSDQSAKKPNYSPEEIEIAKSLNSEREERKYTKLDMCASFYNGRRMEPKLKLVENAVCPHYTDTSFDDFIQKHNNYKND